MPDEPDSAESESMSSQLPIVTTPASERRRPSPPEMAVDVTGDDSIPEPSSGELSPVVSEPDETSPLTRKCSAPMLTELTPDDATVVEGTLCIQCCCSGGWQAGTSVLLLRIRWSFLQFLSTVVAVSGFVFLHLV